MSKRVMRTEAVREGRGQGAGSAAAPPGPRWHRPAFAALSHAYTLSMVGLFVGVPALAVVAIRDGGSPAFGAWAVAMVAMLLLSLRARPRGDAPGRPVSREEAPGLHALVERARRVAGIGPVAEIRVTATPNVGVTRVFRGGILYTRPFKVILLGAPCLRALTVPELAAILVHEFGHFAGEDVRRRERIEDIAARLRGLRRALDRLGPLRWLDPVYLWVRAYAAVFDVVTARVRRTQEIAADALAARHCGPGVYARALLKSAATARLWFRRGSRRAAACVAAGAPPANLFLEFRALVRGLAPEDRRRVLREVRDAPAGRLSTHPPLAERLGRLGGPWVPRRRRREPRAAALLPSLVDVERALTPEAIRVLAAVHVLRSRRLERVTGPRATPPADARRRAPRELPVAAGPPTALLPSEAAV